MTTLQNPLLARHPLAVAIALLLAPGLASAATCTVLNVNDAGADSLRACIASAASGDTIDMSGLTGTIALTTTDTTTTYTSAGQSAVTDTRANYPGDTLLVINKDLILQGPSSGTLALDGGSTNASTGRRILYVASGANVTIRNVTLQNGRARGAAATGGGGGSGGLGGAILNEGNLTLENVIVSGSRAVGSAGGAGTNGGNGGSMGSTAVAGNGLFGIGGASAVGANGFPGGFGAGGGGGAQGTNASKNGFNGGNGGFAGGGGAAGAKYACCYSSGTAGAGGFGAANGTYGSGGAGAGLGAGLFARSGTLALRNVTFNTNAATSGGGASVGRGGALFVCTNTENAACSATIDEANSCGTVFGAGGSANASTTGQATLYWSGASSSAHNTSAITDACTTVPDAPTISAASGADGQATVTFAAPGNDGGSAITGYTVTSSPAGGTDADAGTTSLSHTITGLTNGQTYTFTVTATNAIGTGSPSTASAPVTIKANQTIAFGSAPTVLVDGTGTVSATATSTLGVTFASTTPATCSVSGATVTGITAGACTIAGDQAGDAVYHPAPQQTQTFAIGQGMQTIAFGAAPAIVVGGTGTVSATGGASGNAVTYTSQTTGVCTISGMTVTGVAAGNCTIAADQAGNANYAAAAQQTQTFAIGQGAQTIAFGAAPTVVVGGTGTVSATGGASGNAVTFTSQTSGVCTVSGSTVTGVTAGNCTIAADQAGNADYTAATQQTQTFAIGQGSQAITFGAAPTIAVGGTGTVSATGGASGNAVTFTSQTTSVCTISGATVTGVASGSCTIAADQAGNANYTAAPQAQQTFGIGIGTQAITFGAAPTIAVGGTGTVSATGGASGNAVTYTSQTTSVCTISGTTVTGVAAGICTIAANQAGNANYAAASQQTQSFPIGMAAQTIAFGAAPTVAVGGTGTVSATGGASGNPVTFSSTTPSTCSVSGSTVTGLAFGTCTIAANQAGNANYAAAPQVTQNIAIGYATTTTGTNPVGSGSIAASLTTNPAGCGFQNSQFSTLSPTALAALPGLLAVPYGVGTFTVSGGCGNGASATFTVTYPAALPANAQWWVYGTTAGNPAQHWYPLPGAVVAGNTVTFAIVDGGLGDDDRVANGTIVSTGGIALPGTAPAVLVPTASRWTLLLMAMLMGGVALLRRRRDAAR